MKGKKRVLKHALPWMALIAAYAVSLTFYGLYGMHNLDADISSEMILARILNEEGSLTTLTKSWLYSSELRIVSPVPLYQLGLRLFSSWHAARTFAVALILLLIASSTLFMAREAGFGESAPWLAAVLMLPFSKTYAYIVIYGGFYSMHLACSFVLLGLICRCAKKGLRGSALELSLIALLSLIGGLGGVRMLTMFIVPAFGAAVLLAISEFTELSTFREGAHRPAVRMAEAAGISILLAAAGYLYNAGALARAYRFDDHSYLKIQSFDGSEWALQISRMLGDLGTRTNELFFSQKGLSTFAVLAYFAVMCFSLWRLASRWRERTARQKLFALTSVIAVALGMTLVILLRQGFSRYYIVGTLMLLAVPFFAWEVCSCKNGMLRTGAFALAVAFFLFQSSLVMRFDYTQNPANYEVAADWLLERGYTQGYATYWYSNTLTEASDGQIEMWALEFWKPEDWMNLKVQAGLQQTDHLERDPEGRVFLLVDEMENTQSTPLFDEAHLAGFVAWSYYIYEYDSVDEMRALISQAE